MARRLKGEGSVYFDEKNNRHRWRGTYVDANGVKKSKDIYKPYPLSRTFLREREKQQFLPEPLLLSFY